MPTHNAPKAPGRAGLLRDARGLVDFDALSKEELDDLLNSQRDSRYWMKLADHIDDVIAEEMVEAMPRVGLDERARLHQQVLQGGLSVPATEHGLLRWFALAASAVGLIVAMFGLVLSRSVWSQAPDIVWLTVVLSAAAIVMLRSSWFAAAVLATIAGSFGESLVRLSTGAATGLHLEWVAAASVWFVLLVPNLELDPVWRKVAGLAGCLNLAIWLTLFSGQSSDAWVWPMIIAAIWATKRAFAVDLFRDGRVITFGIAFIPFLLTLAASLVGVAVPEYGSAYITFANLWLSLGPASCVLFALAPRKLRSRLARFGAILGTKPTQHTG